MTLATVPATVRQLLTSAVVAAVVALSALVALPAPAAHADVTFDQQLFTLMNQDRAANGLAPLQSSATMMSVAEDGTYTGCGYAVAGRAADMGARNYFSHTILNCGTKNAFDMLTSAGVAWTSASENIGWESGTVDPVAAAKMLNDQFMNSPGHRANILDPAATHVGVGSWTTAAGQTWAGGGTPYHNVYVTAVVFAHLSTPSPPAPTTTTTTTVPPASTTTTTRPPAPTTTTTTTTRPPAPTTTTTLPPPPPPPPPAAEPPSIVSGIVAGSGAGRAPVSWQPAAANGSAVDLYGIWAFTADGYSGRSAAVCGSCTSAGVEGLANGTAYLFVVVAHNAAGWGDAGFSNWVTPGTPSAPAWMAASPGTSQVRASWAPAAAGASPVDMYWALVYEGPNYTNQSAVTCGTCTSATITGLVSGHAYGVYVLAHNAYGWSPAAGTAFVTSS